MAKMTKDAASQLIAKVPETNAFWCHDGSVYRNLDELKTGLARMSAETFAFHVTPEKNDFSAWVQTSVGDSKLANDLEKAGNHNLAMKRVEERLAFLKDRLV
jgi:hypothetical protein